MSRVVLGVAIAVLAVASGDLSFGRGDRPRYAPNALLIAYSVRDIRRPATCRFAERLDTHPVVLYFFGARVHVDVRPEGMNLINRHGSAIDTLTWTDQRRRLVASGRWEKQGHVSGCSSDGVAEIGSASHSPS